MEEAKSEILSYEEFVQVKEADKAKKITVQAEIPKIYNAVDIANEPTIAYFFIYYTRNQIQIIIKNKKLLFRIRRTLCRHQ